MFVVPATYAVFDPSQMYSAKAEKEAAQAAKKQAKQAAKDAAKLAIAGCGNYSCRICYGVAERVAFVVKTEIMPAATEDRAKQERDVQDFMTSCRGQKIVEIFQACERRA